MKKEDFLQATEELVGLIRSVDFDYVDKIASLISNAISNGRVVYVCGNGGSAADAQHFAAELINRFLKERKPYPAVALTTDSSVLTSIANDYSFDDVFAKQVEALVKEGDVVIGISTSGNSENVFRALALSKQKKATTIGLLGKDGGKIKSVCDYSFVVNSHSTPRIQEVHGFLIHLLCEIVEDNLAE
ncbi:D-sedoheptulose-7-phosphate isomerase [Hippea jasoniae]|uniref:D-sedoheptulose-7-phosphate isomerase n=1 Tax=Hippea jasoniae TaxID=944479 RepID=UPI00054E4139|nr:D-sedoheptulose 7-phosphate isomerase [Hippea jasoniae]